MITMGINKRANKVDNNDFNCIFEAVFASNNPQIKDKSGNNKATVCASQSVEHSC